MGTKTAINDYDLCSALSKIALITNSTDICRNKSGTRQYTITPEKKQIISQGLYKRGVRVTDLSWVGELRTQMTYGVTKPFGYASFIDED